MWGESQLPPTRLLVLNTFNPCPVYAPPFACFQARKQEVFSAWNTFPKCPLPGLLFILQVSACHLLQEAFLASPARAPCTSPVLGLPFPQTMTKNSSGMGRGPILSYLFPCLVSGPNKQVFNWYLWNKSRKEKLCVLKYLGRCCLLFCYILSIAQFHIYLFPLLFFSFLQRYKEFQKQH